MRIRKHAKISPLLYATSSLKAGALIQTHVCQLNQSPWDVMTFSPPSSPPPPPPPPSPPFQANGCGVGAGNGSSGHCISVPERERRWQSEYSAVAPKVEAAAPPPPTEVTVLCCKTDGKSWQCRRVAANGNSLCEHHLSMVRSYNSGGHHASKRSVKPAPVPAPPAEAPRRSRPKKAPATSNPHDFYYYSGFGPRWGGRRGGENRRNGGSMPKNAEEEPAATSRIGIDDFDFEDEFEDEDEAEEEEMGRDNGKKRVRKPIKARSLKSLL